MTDLSACKTQAEVLAWLMSICAIDHADASRAEQALTRMAEIATADTLKAVIAEDSDNFQRGRLAGLEEAAQIAAKKDNEGKPAYLAIRALSSKGGR